MAQVPTEKILFFGYGGNRSQQKIKEILDHDPGNGVGAILSGYTLNVQSLSQIPSTVQSIFQKIYGNEFKAYTIKKGKGIVSGVVWQLTAEDVEKIKQWEFVGDYREIVEAQVTTSSEDAVKVITEKSREEFPTTFIVDGLVYNVFAFAKKEVGDEKDKQYYTEKQIEEIRKALSEQTP